jgi:protein ImuB
MRTYVRMIVCVHVPRFELLVAVGGEASGGAGDADGDAGESRERTTRARTHTHACGLAGGDLGEDRGGSRAGGDRAGGARAAGGRALMGRALALAPQTGGEQRVGEVSGATEACGVTCGMILGEALARCPDLVLVAPDPVAVAERWEGILGALEAIGASVETARPGLAYFAADPLRALHGGDSATIAAAQKAIRFGPGRAGPVRSGSVRSGLVRSGLVRSGLTRSGSVSSAQVRSGQPPFGGASAARIGAGPTRFCALAAALAARPRRACVIAPREARRWLAHRPIDLLAHRRETAALLAPLHRLGVRTLGELAQLGRPALADRFGKPGALAHGLACGEDTPLRPRLSEERLAETMSVGDASSGPALERVLGVLIDRLLARPERRGRTLRAATLSARLDTGGAWRERVVFRQALADPRRIGLTLAARLTMLPAPASTLGLAVERFGPASGTQETLLEQSRTTRLVRLHEAVGQVRAAAGQDAALRAVCVDPDSRVPERRVLLTPFLS